MPRSTSMAGPFARVQPLPGRLDAPPALALWHMASLDAPTVVAVWTLGFAFAAGISLPLRVPALAGLVTWFVYISDRLLDARSALAAMQPSRLRDRHRFHWRHRRIFSLLAAATAIAALAIAAACVPAAAQERGAALALAAAIYFAAVHARRNGRLRWLPSPAKAFHRLRLRDVGNEAAVAIIFTCGCALPIWPDLGFKPTQLWLVPAPIFFLLLVWLNYRAICRWESAAPDSLIAPLGIALALAGLALAAWLRPSHAAAALLLASGAISALLLVLLNHLRARLSSLALRAFADFALVLPLLPIAGLAARSPHS